jgi:flagellar L-ring protein precursor FlgH
MNYMKKQMFVLALGILLAGCATGKATTAQVADQETITESTTLAMYTAPAAADGSLWSDARGKLLYTDSKARRIGDILKVSIVEDPEAELNANTKLSRESGVSASNLEMFGYMKWLAQQNPNMAQDPANENLITAKLGTFTNGKGSSDRDGHIKAYVPAVVTNVYPNGNLFIQGRREITVNHETQYVSVSGIVRTQDINQFNEIASSSIASAQIIYSGSGPIADKQRQGWLTKVLEYVWPF